MCQPNWAVGRVCVQASLAKGVRVQLSCVASAKGQRDVLHVQSISRWAPANIGPYSQAVKVIYAE